MVSLTSRPLGVGYVLAALLAAALAGAAATTSRGPLALAMIAAAICVAPLVARFGLGFVIALLALGSLDALPGPNLETFHVGATITGQDVVVAGLVALLVVENWREQFWSLRRTAWGKTIACWALVFLAWWGATVLRTWVSSPVPLLHAVWWSRDFAYFALLLPLLFGPLRRPDVRSTALLTLAAGAAVAAVAQSAVVVMHLHLSFIVHTSQSGQTSGLTRLYTSAADLPFATLPMALGLVLFGRTHRRRVVGGVLAAISLVAVLVGLTRAIYVGETVGVAGALLLWLLRSDARARFGRRQLAKVGGVVAAVVALFVAYAPASASNSPINGVSARVGSLIADVSGNSSVDASVRTRESEIADMEHVLGPHWILGLGFLDPTYDYVAGVPGGSIRNPDVGVLSAVETMGVIGTAIYAFPLLAVIGFLIRLGLLQRRPSDTDWLTFGVLAWAVAALISSITLVVFFSAAQVPGAAMMLALGASVALPRRTPVGLPPLGGGHAADNGTTLVVGPGESSADLARAAEQRPTPDWPRARWRFAR